MAQTAEMSNTPFLMEGTDRNGTKDKRNILANNSATVRAELRRLGVVPSRIRKQRKGLFSGGGKITSGDFAIFSRLLSTMLAAGIPLVVAFEIVGYGLENAAMHKLILSVNAPDSGAAEEELSVAYGDERLEIGFNAKYLLEIASQVDRENAVFLFNSSGDPTLMREGNDLSAVYVVMPMRV